MNNDKLAAVREKIRTDYEEEKDKMRHELTWLRYILNAEKAHLEDEFVADNVEMMFHRARYYGYSRTHKSSREQTWRIRHVLLASIAEDMRGTNGANWQYSADEVMEFAENVCALYEWAA
jgi:hypothetical protein